MGFLSLFKEDKEPQRDFDLELKQIQVNGLLNRIYHKEELQQKVNEYLALDQLSKVLTELDSDQLDKVLKYEKLEGFEDTLKQIHLGLYKHETLKAFIKVFENGQVTDAETIKIIHERDNLGINHLTLLK